MELHEIEAGKRLCLERPENAAVRCLAGRIRITQLGFADDYYLPGGVTYLSRGDGSILVDSCAPISRIRFAASEERPAAGCGPIRIHALEQVLVEARTLRARSVTRRDAWA